MKTILLTEFGSRVYGTNVPTSDTDYKAIFIPDAKDILLQRAKKTIVETTKANKNSKNSANDIDTEKFAVHQYLDLLIQGQSAALDLLFTPKQFFLQKPDFIWEQIQFHKNEFLHNGVTAFFHYAKNQAAKYGVKGTRVAAMRTILEFLKRQHSDSKLLNPIILNQLYVLIYKDVYDESLGLNNAHIKFTEINGPKGTPELHLEVCNRKIPIHATVKYTQSIFQKIFDEYGARALAAEKNLGVDWKSLMHAVRVCNQAKELLTTAHITFPRPEASLLLQIRKGEMPYKDVASLIEQGLEDLENLKGKSILRDKPNQDIADSIVEQAYSHAVKDEYV